MTARTGDRPSKLLGLQYLRGIAALGVVLYHATGRGGEGIRVGEAGVDVFFALSGFLMVMITSDRTTPAAFLADRARRIVPLYWIATTVMLGGVLLRLFPRVKLTAWHLISSYAFLPSWSPSSGHLVPLLVPGWTLNLEMMFYVVFAATLALRDMRRALIAITALFGAFVAIGPFVPAGSAAGSLYSEPIILEFVAGAWLGFVWKRGATWPGWLAWPCIALAVALLALFWDLPQSQERVLPFGVPALMLLFGVLTLEREGRVPVLRLPLLLGDASYSIYLWHTLAISVVLKAGRVLGLGDAAIVAIGMVSGTAVGIASYYALERPILRFFRERRAVRGVPVPAAP